MCIVFLIVGQFNDAIRTLNTPQQLLYGLQSSLSITTLYCNKQFGLRKRETKFSLFLPEHFYPRDAMHKRGLCCRYVCPSVCPSRSGIVS